LRSSTSNILKITGSVGVSLIAGYLAFRGVHLKQVMAAIHRVDLSLIAVVITLMALAQVVRSLRWGLLLQPLQPLSQRLLLPITCIGFLFVWILPARLGEMARPYLLRQNSPVGLSAAMGSVVLERLVDASFLVFLLAACLPALSVPDWLVSSLKGFVYLLVTAVLLLLLGSLPRFRELILQTVSRFLSKAASDFVVRIVETFYDGMQAVTSLQRLLSVLALTLVIWGLNVIAYFLLFPAMDLQLGWLAATTVLVLTCLGIALPAAPGFIGNYHYACVVALGLFGVVKETALAYAILIHFLVMVVIVFMGVICMTTVNLRVSFSLKRREFAEEE
jgi:uncharacterized protein (TIRG00374 family)